MDAVEVPGAARGRKPAHGDPVVDRALAVLGAFDPEHRRLRLTELSRRAGLPLSTARRLTQRLVSWGALEQSAGGYVIGLRLWEVGSLAPRAVGLREVASPLMDDLFEATRQHVLLAVLDGEQALLVERRSSRGAVPVAYRVGERLPLHGTGVGLVLLAHAGGELCERVLRGDTVDADSIPAPDSLALRETLERIRQSGIVTIKRWQPAPAVSVAAPVWGEDDRVVAALSVVLSADGVSPRTVEPAVRAAARAVSRGMFAPGSRTGPSANLR